VYAMGFPDQYGATGHASDNYGASDNGSFPNHFTHY
jgi:hypothetical protein